MFKPGPACLSALTALAGWFSHTGARLFQNTLSSSLELYLLISLNSEAESMLLIDWVVIFFLFIFSEYVQLFHVCTTKIYLLHQRIIASFLETGLSHCSQNVTGFLPQSSEKKLMFATLPYIGLFYAIGYNFITFHLKSSNKYQMGKEKTTS